MDTDPQDWFLWEISTTLIFCWISNAARHTRPMQFLQCVNDSFGGGGANEEACAA